jgi:putative transposase
LTPAVLITSGRGVVESPEAAGLYTTRLSRSSELGCLTPDPRLVDRLRRAERRLSRRCKFGKNGHKARGGIQRIHARLTNQRLNRVHKLTAQISKSHAVVCLEKLQIGNMTRRPRAGTGDVNCKAYKAWHGGQLVLVPPRYTSRTCPQCRFQSKENRVSQARFSCRNCGYEANADLVGAMNIPRAGHAQLARGDTSLVGASA